ncbi:MAG: glycosyltransferase family 2 protein [Alphaproteobacteria bacterium]|nr:glycosyltransferase family 2 protein [Alphaproteobacteria bacterium]
MTPIHATGIPAPRARVGSDRPARLPEECGVAERDQTSPEARRYPTVAVVIPALDEERSLPLTLAEIPPVGHVIVVDNGSTDGTARVAAEAGAVVVSEPRRGYGQACQAGIARAAALGAEILVILDADHSDYPEELPLLVDPILAGDADLVLGERVSRAEPGSLMPQQRYGNVLATFLIRRVTGHRYRDMGPFRAIRMDALLALGLVDPNYGWNVEWQIKAVRQGLRIREVPVGYRPRIGQSKISGTVRGTVRAGAKIIWSTWRYR